MRDIRAGFVSGRELYRTVVLEKMAGARESVWISTANLKAMMVEIDGAFQPVVELFSKLAAKGVELRILHAELPSRPFRAAFDKRKKLTSGGLELKFCPRVHFKAVIVDGAWLYLGSANLTGAGLGAKGDDKRNFEVGLVTEDFELIDRTRALFNSIWTGGECGTCKLRDICPDPLGPAKSEGKGRRSTSGRSGIQLGHTRRLRVAGRRWR
jgi:phosphatidylserine/phosphatidylglycerophosphate/cardiolipin synthase-like enzyme